ncbi:MAG TPA: sulfotransferase family 2 domain-containing protein [Bryobacteraceae bacterium]|nr:sulfotransferase family 2 domain-containing protein [Bryobacteraceae bacterium]
MGEFQPAGEAVILGPLVIGLGAAILLGPVLAAILAYIANAVLRRTGRDQKAKLLLFFLFEKFVFPVKTASDKKPTLLGRLDGSVDGELYGWALNPKDLSTAPKITVCVENRPVGEILAVHYRPDIGKHCFYFDLTRLCAPDPATRVDAKFSDGRLLPNSPLILTIPSRPEPPAVPAILFMHIAKTAGTAFREAMEENYKQSEIAYLYPDPPGFLIENLHLLPLEQRRAFRLVIGHFQYGIHDALPQPWTYVTVVREPVSRIVSHYRYALEMQSEDASGSDSAASLVEALERRATVNLDNLMVRCFSGVDEKDVPPGSIDSHVYALAVDHLRSAFSFVGHQERSDQAYAELHRRYNWKSRSTLTGVNKSRLSSERDYTPARAAIEHFNRWDCRLYTEICQLFP